MTASAAPDLSFLKLPRYDTDTMAEMVIPSGSGAVAADWHLPLACEKTSLRLIEEAKWRKTRDWLAIPGDYLNLDAWSDYYPKHHDHELTDEFRMAKRLMRILLGTFDDVYVALGNHDLRAVKAMGFKIRFEHAMEMLLGNLPDSMMDRLHFTGRDYLIHPSPEGEWRFCHTRQYAVSALSVPMRIADINQQHVIAAHRHHHALGRSPSGLWAGEAGMLMDDSKVSYIQRWTTTHPKMAKGFFIIKNGVPAAPLLHG